jgi:hypothetical protein
VNKAETEHKESPFRTSIRLFCALDKAILVCACKHVQASGESEMGTDMLWLRLQDFIRAYVVNSTLPSSAYSSSSSSSAIRMDDSENNNSGSKSLLAAENEPIPLLLPPYSIFEQAIYRLIEHGIFKLVGNVTNLQAIALLRLCAFKFPSTIDIAEVIGALHGTPFARCFK